MIEQIPFHPGNSVGSLFYLCVAEMAEHSFPLNCSLLHSMKGFDPLLFFLQTERVIIF